MEKVPDQWRAVARFGNLAEVGFFADLLEGHSIESRIHHQHKFHAMDGEWQTTFELLVQAADVERAVSTLREEINDPANQLDDDFAATPNGWSETSLVGRWTSRPSAIWTPVLWAIIAGGVGYLAGRISSPGAPAPTAQSDLFWRIVAETAPLRNVPRPNVPPRILRLDAARQTLVLEEDDNGDGRYDRVRALLPAP